MIKDKIELGLCLGLSFTIIGGMFTFVGVHHAKTKQEAKAYEDSYTIIQELSEKIEDITEVDDIFEFVESANETKAKVVELTKKYNSRAKERVEDTLYDVQQSAVNKILDIALGNTTKSSNYLKLESSGVEKYGDNSSWINTKIKAKEKDKEYYGVYESVSDIKHYQTASKPATYSISHEWTSNHGWVSAKYDTQTITSEGKVYGGYNYRNPLLNFSVDDVSSITLSKENGSLIVSAIAPIDRSSPNLQVSTTTFTIDAKDCLTNYSVSNCSRDCSYTLSSLSEYEFNQVKESILAKYDAIELSNNQEQ